MKTRLFKLLEVGSRNVDFFCESDELEKFITDWLAVKNWNYSDFSRILKILKVEKPVKLRQFSDRSFEIYSIHSQSSIYATLFSSHRDPKEHSIMISDKKFQRVYNINYHYNGIPLKLKILKESTANTESIYLNTFQITTQVDDYILKISSSSATEFEGGVLQQYISNLNKEDFCYNVALIYQRIRSILNVHLKNNKSLYIVSLKMLSNNKTKLLSSMRFDSKGDLTEFAKTNSVEETFHVFENGNWHYSSSNGNIIISYNSVRNHYNFNIVGGYHAIELVGNPIDLLNAILPEILELKNCLGSHVL